MTTSPSNVLVVAVYQEDVKWLRRVPRGWKPLIVTKDVDVPNEGREAASFLWAMRQDTVRDADHAAFVQGNPFDHCPDLFDRLKDEPNGGFEWLGEPYVCRRDGSPHDPGLPLADMHLRWTSRRLRGDEIQFAAGGQFVLPGAMIRRISPKHLGWLYREVCRDRNAWVMERLWRPVLEAPEN